MILSVKKIAAFVSAFILLITGCASENSDPVAIRGENAKLSVIATIFPPYDFAKEIGGERAEVKMLVTPGGDSHSSEPTSSDILAVRNCDIFICGGGESDVWARDILASINTENKKVIRMMDCVKTLEEEITDGMRDESGEHGDEIEYDEHVWTSPLNAIKISREIAAAMTELDPDNIDIYARNLEDYVAKLTALDNDFRAVAENSSMKPLVFGDRFPFRYLADELGITYYAAFPGCSSETEASAAVISRLIELIRENDVGVVYHIEYSSEKIARVLAAETGAESLLLHSCHTISQEDMDGGASYIGIMRENLPRLEKGLG